MSDDSPPSPPSTGGDGPVDVPPPNGGSGGPVPPKPGAGGPSRRPNTKRIALAVVLVGALLVGGVVFALGGVPSVPGFGGCEANPDATVVYHQSAGDGGERVALQLTNVSGTDGVMVKYGDSTYTTLTDVGDTTTLDDLSEGDTITMSAQTECGPQTVDEYTVE